MALNDIMIHDDDAGTTPAEIDASDFIDGGDVPIVIDGEIPTLMCIDSALYDTVAAGTSLNILNGCRWALLPPTWPSTLIIADQIDLIEGIFETEAIQVHHYAPGRVPFIVAQDTNMAHKQRYIGPNTTWVNSGDSRVWGTSGANDIDFSIVLHQQYKKPGVFPFRGGPIIHIRKSIAAASITTADLWDTGLQEVLSDDTPALDPDKYYRLHKIACVGEATSASEYCLGVRFSVVGADQWHAIGIGSGQVVSGFPIQTVFMEDSVPPFQGNRTVKVDVLTNDATNDDYLVDLWLEEYSSPSGGGGGGAGTTQAIGGATAARSPLFTANAGSGQPVQPAGAGIMNFRNLAQMFKMG